MDRFWGWLKWLIALPLVGAALIAEATGPSSVDITLDPVAVSKDGQFVVIRSRLKINPTGAHARLAETIEWGWIVVSRSGDWREGVASSLPGATSTSGEDRYLAHVAREDAAHRWVAGSPPPAALGLLLPQAPGEFVPPEPKVWNANAVWRPGMPAQRTVHGWASAGNSSDTSVEAKACVGNIAIFRNRETPDEALGAAFGIPSGIEFEINQRGEVIRGDPGIEVAEVDAIALVRCE